MEDLQKIMVVIDANEDYSNAPDGLPIELRKALQLVQDKGQTELKLISVGYERYLSHSFRSIGYDYTKLRQEYVTRLKSAMDQMVEKLSAEGYSISCEVGWAHPRYEAIVKMAQDFGADLLIQHCRAFAKLKNEHLTHESWNLVKHCPLPLLLVKDANWFEPFTVMVAVDPVHSHNKPLRLDHKLITAADTFAKNMGGKCHVIHAYAETARPFAPAGQIKAEHEAAFNELMSDFDISAEQRHLVDDDPVDAIHAFEKSIGADVVVMGAISRSRFSEALVGSTAESVLDYVKIDILVVKPDSA
jgi:universal stress protein E